MTFLDSKEDVFDFVISRYGRYLLSQGKFDPKFYSFSDDDIIYDGRYAGLEQSQSQVESRILESPRLSEGAYGGSSGFETEFKNTNLGTLDFLKQQSSCGLGSSEIGNKYMPAWRIQGHNSTNIQLSSSQIFSTTLNFNISSKPIDVSIETGEAEQEGIDNIHEFFDGTKVVVKGNYILLDFQEKNVQEINDQFEFFVARYDQGSSEPVFLSMLQDNDMVQGDKLVNDPSFNLHRVQSVSDAVNDPDSTEYYFEILCDSDVDDEAREVLCSVYNKDVKAGFTYLSRIIECPDKVRRELKKRVDIYKSDVKPEEVREKCE